MTYLQIINAVLRRLRESEVASPTTTTYATLIGDFVNQTKREVEDAWKWHALRTQIQVTTAASTSQYSLTGAGNRFRFIDTQRRAWDATNKGWVWPQNSTLLKQLSSQTSENGLPQNYYIEGLDGSGDPYVNFYTTPDGVYTINFDLVVPQADLSSGSTVLSVPEWPVILGTYAKALSERGEDNGKTHGEALNQFGFALSDAIAMDAALGHDEDEWYVE